MWPWSEREGTNRERTKYISHIYKPKVPSFIALLIVNIPLHLHSLFLPSSLFPLLSFSGLMWSSTISARNPPSRPLQKRERSHAAAMVFSSIPPYLDPPNWQQVRALRGSSAPCYHGFLSRFLSKSTMSFKKERDEIIFLLTFSCF